MKKTFIIYYFCAFSKTKSHKWDRSTYVDTNLLVYKVT